MKIYIDTTTGSVIHTADGELYCKPINSNGTVEISYNPYADKGWAWLDMSLVEEEFHEHYNQIKATLEAS